MDVSFLSLRPADAAARVEKRYWALVQADSSLPPSGEVSTPLLRKKGNVASLRPAYTRFSTIQRSESTTWLELSPLTGTRLEQLPPLNAHQILELGM